MPARAGGRADLLDSLLRVVQNVRCQDVGYATTPETYGLSEELGEDLAAWQAFFEEHANPFKGWDSDANLQKWLSDGEAIAVRLQHEVQSFADVRREFGPWRDRL